MKRSVVIVSFASENQLPYLMIIKEDYEDGQLIWAEVLYKLDSPCMDEFIIEGPIRISKGMRHSNAVRRIY